MVEQLRDLNRPEDTATEPETAEHFGQVRLSCWRYSEGQWSRTEPFTSVEFPLQIVVNGSELVTILCTPLKLNVLVAGFLYNEGIINSLKDIAMMRVCEEDYVADVRLVSKDYVLPTRRMLTSGCGGGASFIEQRDSLARLEPQLKVGPEDILALMKQVYQKAEMHQRGGGVHASALCDEKNVIVLCEDIGRHNTLDKIKGECLFMDIPTRDRILVTTGRISSEMLLKAGRMEVPVIVSRSAPLTRAVSLAEKLGIAVVGYVRANHLEVYSHCEMALNCPDETVRP